MGEAKAETAMSTSTAMTDAPVGDAAAMKAAPRKPDDALFHGVLLAAAALVVALSMLLSVRDASQVLIPLTNVPLPDLCTFRRITGIDCPGCGLTRSFIALGHGDAARAWTYNPAGWLLYAVVVFQLPYRSWQLWRVTRGKPEMQLGALGTVAMAAAAGAVMIQWLWRQAGGGW